MRVRLRGINSITKKLADGTHRTYWYAWKGGPPLRGEPGTPEFIAGYNEAVARKVVTPQGTLLSVLQAYQQSETVSGRRMADYSWAVLARVLSWGLDRGLVLANPCANGGKLYRATRRENIWTAVDEATFLERAPSHLHLPLLLALWTGQRQGDLLRLPWSAYDGTHIRLRQSKTGARVVVRVGAPLKAALDSVSKVSPIILINSNGKAWSSPGFRAAWQRACRAAGVTGLTFHDLRGTAVTRLALVGCTVAEIASVTGHSLRDVHMILDSHYLARDPALGEAAIRKLETGTKSPN